MKPCPFCGKNEQKIMMDTEMNMFKYESGRWQVFCDASTANARKGCGASAGFYATKEAAIEAWNERKS